MRNILTGIGVTLFVTVISLSTFAASDTAQNTAYWSHVAFVELSLDNATFDFGTLDAGVDEVAVNNAVKLTVRSNTSWSLSYEVIGEGAEHFEAMLTQDSGHRNQSIPVTYRLFNLLQLEPGDYEVTVKFTITTE